MMKVLLILASLWTAILARRLTCHACLNTICYSRVTILKGHKFSGQLAIDRTSNVIYFHYQNKKHLDFTGAFDLYNIKLKTIPTLGFTFGHTVDQTTRDLYASGAQGLYKHNPINNETGIFGLREKTIWRMQFTDKLYYTEFKQKGLYTYSKNNMKGISELSNYQIDDFIIDLNNDTYFMSNFAIYVYKSDTKKLKVFANEIYSLTTDRNGEAYFIQTYTRGVYKIDYKTGNLTEIGAFSKGSPVEVIFDSDNHVIYYDATDMNLYYLSPTMNKCNVATRNFGKKSRKFVAMLPRKSKTLLNTKYINIIPDNTHDLVKKNDI